MLAFEGISLHPALDVLREIGAVVFGHSLKHRLEDDAVGTVRHRFGGSHNLNAALAQLCLVDG